MQGDKSWKNNILKIYMKDIRTEYYIKHQLDAINDCMDSNRYSQPLISIHSFTRVDFKIRI